MLKANLLVVLSTGPVVGLLAWVYSAQWGARALMLGVYGLLEPRILLTTVVPGILAHELIHALTWSILARRPLSAIAIGFHWRALSPYAHPRDPMLVGPYRAGAMMPALLLGFVPAGIGLASGSPLLTAWSLLLILAAGGDLAVLWLLRRVPADRLVEDHPTRAGCRVLPE
jgi:hypothetical protein